MDDGKVREASATVYSWHWPWYRILLLYVCGMILGVVLVLLLYRLRHAESVIVPVLSAVAMLLATVNEIRAAWQGRGPETDPRPSPHTKTKA